MDDDVEGLNLSAQEMAELEAELRAMMGEENPPVKKNKSIPASIPLILHPWPIPNPAAIPSLSVLRWSGSQLQKHIITHPDAASKCQEVQNRIGDLEQKIRSGTVPAEKLALALNAMLKKIESPDSANNPLTAQWVALVQHDLQGKSSSVGSFEERVVSPLVGSNAADEEMLDDDVENDQELLAQFEEMGGYCSSYSCFCFCGRCSSRCCFI